MQSITNHINNKFKKYSGNATQYYLPITKQWYTCRRLKKILQLNDFEVLIHNYL